MGFSVKHLLFVVLAAAVSLAALTNAYAPLVAELFELFTLAILVIVGYSAWVQEKESRAFLIGFAAWGGIYFLISIPMGIAVDLAPHGILRLLAGPLESRLKRWVGPNDIVPYSGRDWIDSYFTVGHSIFALLFGLIGGCVTVYFYGKRQRMLCEK